MLFCTNKANLVDFGFPLKIQETSVAKSEGRRGAKEQRRKAEGRREGRRKVYQYLGPGQINCSTCAGCTIMQPPKELDLHEQ